MKNCSAFLAGLMTYLFAAASAVTASAPIDQMDFESGVTDYWYRAMNDFSYSGNTVTTHCVSPAHGYRFELHDTDPLVEDGKRAELEGPAEPPLQERIYTFSIYLPSGGAEDYAVDNPNAGEVIAQWHNNPDPGEEWTRPPLALFTDTRSDGTGYYFLQREWDEDPISTDEKLEAEGKIFEYDLGSYEGDKGKWVTWTFHVRWGWLPAHHPLLEVYKDGVLIKNLNGLPNTTNDQRGVNQQFGLYKWDLDSSRYEPVSKLTRRVIYYDDVSVVQVLASDTPTPTATPPTVPNASAQPICVFPCPYLEGVHTSGNVVFKGVPAEASIRIYSVAGRLVRTLPFAAGAEDGRAEWDVTGVSGGIYLYVVKSSRGRHQGKISLVK